jgi:hypothetical protein
MARTLSEEDLEAIGAAVANRQHSHCRYDVDPVAVKDAMEFFQTFTEAVADTKKTARRWLTVFILTAFATFVAAGVLSRLKVP